jgi:hypothetical protein
MSRAEKRQMVLDLWDRQILTPDQKDRVLKMIDMPSDLDALMQDDVIDRDRANEENEAFLGLGGEEGLAKIQQARGPAILEAEQETMSGIPGDDMAGTLRGLGVEPRDFENHQVHLERHNRFRKGRQYRALSPQAQAIVDEHCDRHSQFLALMAGGGMMPDPAGGGDPLAGPESATPGALIPGQPPQAGGDFGAGAPTAEQAGDQASGMPMMPKTPTPGGMRQQG